MTRTIAAVVAEMLAWNAWKFENPDFAWEVVHVDSQVSYGRYQRQSEALAVMDRNPGTNIFEVNDDVSIDGGDMVEAFAGWRAQLKAASPMGPSLNGLERDMVLAALRLWQATATRAINPMIMEIATMGGLQQPLSDDAIDNLCERINIGPFQPSPEHKLSPPGPLEPPLDEIVEAEQLVVARAVETIAGKTPGEFYAMPKAGPRPSMARAPDPWHIGELPGDEDRCTIRDQNGLIVQRTATPEQACAMVDENNFEAA
jgi:hypothetical protein